MNSINSISDPQRFEAMLKKHEVPTIQVIDIQEGSIKLIIEGCEEDIERLLIQIKSGELTELDGFPVEDVQILSESSEDDESSEKKWRLVEEIVTNQITAGRDLNGADFSDADLRNVYLRGANLRDADLSGSDLSGSDLRNAYLRGANLRDTDLRDADLSGADLSGADLSGADLRGADLSGANLSDANLNGIKLDKIQFLGNLGIDQELKKDRKPQKRPNQPRSNL
ncbi:pentapeptide repeat-containing protein [Lyngbya sp. CCAP 1446/10]|nr:pentapeptide repeat-containing protein [Lyngbya sp. CCAP 1446/10]